MTALDYSKLRYLVTQVARSCLGQHEVGGNNRGPFIEAMGGRPGEEWCGLLVNYVFRRAYDELRLPYPAWLYRRGTKLETGARALTRALGAHGRIKRPEVGFAECGWSVRPGDIVCWSRGTLGWQRHVGIVTEGMRYIAGNEGFDGAVKERRIADSKLKLWRYASVER